MPATLRSAWCHSSLPRSWGQQCGTRAWPPRCEANQWLAATLLQPSLVWFRHHRPPRDESRLGRTGKKDAPFLSRLRDAGTF